MAAVQVQDPIFLDNDDLIDWLESNEIVELTASGDWPTAATATIWADFRTEMLDRTARKWSAKEWRHNVNPETRANYPEAERLYRVEVNRVDNSVWTLTPDFQRVLVLRLKMIDRQPSVLTARIEEGGNQAIIKRLGRSQASWSQE